MFVYYISFVLPKRVLSGRAPSIKEMSDLPDDRCSWLLNGSEDALPHYIFTCESEQLQADHLYVADAEQRVLPVAVLQH